MTDGRTDWRQTVSSLRYA